MSEKDKHDDSINTDVLDQTRLRSLASAVYYGIWHLRIKTLVKLFLRERVLWCGRRDLDPGSCRGRATS